MSKSEEESGSRAQSKEKSGQMPDSLASDPVGVEPTRRVGGRWGDSKAKSSSEAELLGPQAREH